MLSVTKCVAVVAAVAGCAMGVSAAPIGFEAAEGYVVGNIAGQNGWFDNAPNGTMRVENGVDAGNGSANALRLSVGAQAQGTFGIVQAPLTAGSTALSVDTRIDDNGGGDYFVRGLALVGAGAVLSFRVQFNYEGTILLQDGANLVDTLVPWAPNQWNTLSLQITPTAINYFYGATPLGSTPIQGAVTFDLVQFGHDNFQAFGGGSFSGGGNPAAGYFDNLDAIPAPGAATLLGLGGLLATRRRRA